MRTIDPIFVAPRFVGRSWGRYDLGDWCKAADRASEPIGEAWIFDAANASDRGPLGRSLAQSSSDMLGEVGRAPPKLRLVFPGEPTAIKSTAPVSLWHVLEPGDPPTIAASNTDVRHKPGQRIRAFEGASVPLAKGCVALEISSTFQPTNRLMSGPAIARLPSVSARTRATLFRDAALSVETWMLPQRSLVEPDGETCHVLVALTSGIAIDGRELRQGEAMFIPAWGRPLQIAGSRAKALVAYPDQTPTTIWRHVPGPDPVPGMLPKPEPVRPSAMAISLSPEPALAA
jgi:hypothetical protein